MIAAIASIDNNWGIGYDGELLERIPEDMKYFKEITTNHTIVMGRNTWESLPSHPLPNRINIVITHTGIQCSEMTMFISIEEAITRIRQAFDDEKWFIIGGGSIYEQLLPYCDTVFLTHIGKDHKNVDTYFPRIDKDPNWEIDTCTELRESITGIPYAFLTYKRV